jgi:serine/threonine-protein kinase HipA
MVFDVLVLNVDDHLRNQGFLWRGPAGGALSRADDLNRTPTGLKPRVLPTKRDIDEGACDLDLGLNVAEFFALSLTAAKTTIGEVGLAVATWRQGAEARGARASAIKRMAGATADLPGRADGGQAYRRRSFARTAPSPK